MKYVYDDGGRSAAGFKGFTGDCVTRAIAIATNTPYGEVYRDINLFCAKTERKKKGQSSARTGIRTPTIRKYLKRLGWSWTPTMHIGSGCRVHLAAGELPMGRLIVAVSKHLTVVIDGVIYDTHDPQRSTVIYDAGSTSPRVAGRCVYGYYQREED